MGFTYNSLPGRIKTDKFRQQGILVLVELIGIRYHSQALRLSSCLLRVSHSVRVSQSCVSNNLYLVCFIFHRRTSLYSFFLCLPMVRRIPIPKLYQTKTDQSFSFNYCIHRFVITSYLLEYYIFWC